MPEAVAEIVQALAVAGFEDPVLRIEVADIGQVLVQTQLVILPGLEHGRLEWPEVAREGELRVVLEMLIGEHQHRILGERRADGREIGGSKRLRQVDVAHFGDEIRRCRLDGDGHGWLPILCSGVIGPPNGRGRKCVPCNPARGDPQ